MKNLLFIPLLLFTSLMVFTQENEGIQFIEDKSFEEVLALAEQEDKIIFMDCYTTWCGPCIALSKNIFPQKQAGDYFNQHFIPVKYDMEKGEGKKIMEKYDVKAFPTLLFLNGKGEIVYKHLGAPQKAEDLVDIGKKAINPENDYQTVMNKMNHATMDSELSAETIAKYLRMENPDQPSYWLDKYINALDEDSLYTKQTILMIDRYSNGFFDQHFQFLLAHEDTFKQKTGNDELIDNAIMNKMINEMMKASYVQQLDHPMVEKAHLKAEYISNKRTFQQNSDSLETWKNFIQATNRYFKNGQGNVMEMNNAAWLVYENYKKFEDQDAFEKASQWAKKSVEMEKNKYNLDTYAAFMFEMGETQKAYELQVEAVELIEGSNQPGYIKAYKKRLEKYKEANKM